jgi:hypothetical protein
MVSVGGAEARRPRRWARITGGVMVAVLAVGLVGWQIAARTSVVEPGSSSHSGAGATLPDCVPHVDDAIWSMFGNDEEVVVLQTVRNPSRWPVTVISTNPEAYRFEPMADDFREDYLYEGDPADGPPPTPVKLRALGVERDFYLPFRGRLTVGGDEATAARLDRALQEACEA